MIKKCSQLISSFIINVAFSFALLASNTETMWVGSQYDSSIPTFDQVLGYGVGEKITKHV